MGESYPEFSGQHVIVTGAASGIGKAITMAFIENGANVTACDKDRQNLEILAKHSERIYPLPCDLSNLDDLEPKILHCFRSMGPAAVLVNNAGVDRRMSLENQSHEDFRWMLSVNLEHHHFMAKLVADGMRELGGGAIINLSSTAWMKSAEHMTAYHAAKAAIVGLTKGLARDLGSDLIRVNAIAPGRVYTERAKQNTDHIWVEDTKKLQCIPELILPSDIANTALWLASKNARMMTGQTIIVDGGVV